MPRYTNNAETPIPTTPRWETPIRNSVADFNAVPRKPLDRKLILNVRRFPNSLEIEYWSNAPISSDNRLRALQYFSKTLAAYPAIRTCVKKNRLLSL